MTVGGNSVGAVTAAVDRLAGAARTGGGFVVSEEGGKALIAAIDNYVAKLDQHLTRATVLTQQLPLGTSPAAHTFVPYLSTIAGDDAQGAIPVMTQLRERLTEAKTIIEQSMRNYLDTEYQNMRDLPQQNPGDAQ